MEMAWKYILLAVLILSNRETTGSGFFVDDGKVCRGTSSGLGHSGEAQYRYEKYLNRYTNCTYIDGNLEIIFLDSENVTDFDLSFLSTIQEVTGYILIFSVYIQYIPLGNLRIIRGRTLFEHNGESYSLYIALNSKPDSKTQGLMELQMKSLSEIILGKVFFSNNNLLCYEMSISWSDIQPTLQPPVKYEFEFEHYKRPCGECHPSCYNEVTDQRHCWGAGPDMCQILSWGEVCSKTCDGRCFGNLPNQCCHPQCVASCTGQENTECLACRNFYNDGKCVARCPEEYYYDTNTFTRVKNPNARFTYGSLCVPQCPDHLLKDQGTCVKACGLGKQAVNNTCVDCDGPCPLRCHGIEGSNFLDSQNIHEFKDCTIIDGNIRILVNTFEGDPHKNITPLQPDQLTVFETVKEITGYLLVQGNTSGFHSLKYFSNLQTIAGRNVDGSGYSFQIVGTNLRSLELTSLKSIKNGNVLIGSNLQLCYVKSINFRLLFSSPNQEEIMNNRQGIYLNRNLELCKQEGKVCSSQCSDDGCWGFGEDKCLSCKNYRLEKSSICMESCSDSLMFTDGNECKHCDDQCLEYCYGPGPGECYKCKNVQLMGMNETKVCSSECPTMMYPDDDKVCQQCHTLCSQESGCTGPSEEVMSGGCNSCELGILHVDSKGVSHTYCIHKEDGCPKSHFEMAGKRLCEPCHDLCNTCLAGGVAFCGKCKYYKEYGRCVQECRSFMYIKIENTIKTCMDCNNECRQGCSGPTTTDCSACQNFKVYINESTDLFNCTTECPPDKPNHITDKDDDQGLMVCAGDDHPKVLALRDAEKEEEKKRILTIAVPVVGGTLLFGLLLAIFGYHWRRRAIAKENTAKLTARMTGYDETEPLTPTDAKPDLAQLRLVKENELRRGGIIGSGAFGTVYKGFWIPDGENVKIPVAIKVLLEGTSPNQNKELLEEARVMASVNDPCCTRILAVCMTAQMMLITQLMPLGCLLDYVRKHKENIGSKVLLNWCTQIAKGMLYLEGRGIVHRDLAARNVLVQSPCQVRITDFGLAKLLNYNEDQYQAAGGKMPIKWLALECIQHRIFTHKSDIWSYGVTVWELFTYGQRPYENIRAREVPDLLEKGERLPQPAICTIDVYMIMIKCWMLDADSRPSFQELGEEFSKMARDPGRYLVIQGDQLMRLPSHSIDKGDLIRSLSVAADGPEQIIEAEEYLQPQTTRQVMENNNVKTPLLQGYAGGATNFDVKEKEVAAVSQREKRYGHLESAAAARQQREQSPARGHGDNVNSRYSSDPIRSDSIKFFKDRDEIDGIGIWKQRTTSHSGSVGGSDKQSSSGGGPSSKPLQLAVDEDNYLQPRSSNPTSYMQLTDGKDYYHDEKILKEEDENSSQYVPMDSPLHIVDNPEYFDGDVEQASENHPVNDIEFLTNKPKDSAYYNDIKEARPLLLSDCSNSETNV